MCLLLRLRAASYLAVCGLTTFCWSQQFGTFERGEAQTMLRDVASDVQKHYYDPSLHGVDWEQKTRETKDAIDKATSMSMALADVAALLDSLHDSHPSSNLLRVQVFMTTAFTCR
jgi:Tricorn protease C1 domain